MGRELGPFFGPRFAAQKTGSCKILSQSVIDGAAEPAHFLGRNPGPFFSEFLRFQDKKTAGVGWAKAPLYRVLPEGLLLRQFNT